MDDEMIDLLDENGNVVGVQSKKMAHQTGAWHKAVHIYLVNNEGEILLQKRSANKDIFPNVWDVSVGGHTDAGEKNIETAQRELEEELGVKSNLDDFQFLTQTKEILKTGKYVSSEFVDAFLVVKDVRIENIVLQEAEVADIKFVKLEEFFEMARRKDAALFPHYDEYEKILPILENLKISKK